MKRQVATRDSRLLVSVTVSPSDGICVCLPSHFIRAVRIPKRLTVTPLGIVMATKISTTDGNVARQALITDTLQYRLETGNIAKQGGQRGSLTRCAQKLGIVRNTLEASHPDAEKIKVSKKGFRQDIELFKLELLKLILQHKNITEQVDLNQETIDSRQADIDELSQQVKAGQSDANQAFETKQCFEEYEALARITNEQHPKSTLRLEEDLATTRMHIDDLKKEDAVADRVLKVREGQLQLLMHYVTDLKRSLVDTKEQEKLLLLAQNPRADESLQNGGSLKSTDNTDIMHVDEEEDVLYGDMA